MTPVEASGSDAVRQVLVNGVLAFLADQDRLALQEIRDSLAHEIDVAGAHALLALKARLTTDAGWDYYEPDPLVRRIHHCLGRRFLRSDSRVVGAEFITLPLREDFRGMTTVAGCSVGRRRWRDAKPAPRRGAARRPVSATSSTKLRPSS